ncbi:MAG: hypothetical protein ABR501_05675 [Pyrinomonadaceae bacterium]
MQKDILAKYPSAKLRVYVVWFSVLPTDARSRWKWTGGILTDNRVIHFWDEQKTVGRWFAQQEEPQTGEAEFVWDAYYLYGADAQWDHKPEPLKATGATVRAEADRLKNALIPLL